jgi:hypothetical protein
MASTLNQEVRSVQNPGLGAMLLWRCSSGFSDSRERGDPIPLPLLFLVLPIMFHEETADVLASTQRASGLRKFAEKFQLAAQNKTDLLLAIGPRAQTMRRLTMHSIGIAILSRLMAIDQNSATVIALSRTPAIAGIPASVRPLLVGADKLGSWFAQLSLYETALLLQVRI